jgi:hypothetical protein
MPGPRLEERQQIQGAVQAIPARLINADSFGSITAAGLDELVWPGPIEHVAANCQIIEGQGQERGGAQNRFRLGKDVIVHQQNVRRAVGVLCFEQTARETPGPASIVLMHKMQPISRGSRQRGEIGAIAYLVLALIDDNDALQQCGDIGVGEEGGDVANELGCPIERANADGEAYGSGLDCVGHPFRLIHSQRGRLGFYLEVQQSEVPRSRSIIR